LPVPGGFGPADLRTAAPRNKQQIQYHRRRFSSRGSARISSPVSSTRPRRPRPSRLVPEQPKRRVAVMLVRTPSARVLAHARTFPRLFVPTCAPRAGDRFARLLHGHLNRLRASLRRLVVRNVERILVARQMQTEQLGIKRQSKRARSRVVDGPRRAYEIGHSAPEKRLRED